MNKQLHPSKNVIKNIACGTLSSFVSRYTDVDGYWAVGKICKLMIDNSLNILIIDVLNCEMNFSNELFDEMIYKTFVKFKLKLNEYNLEVKDIKNLIITVHFQKNIFKSSMKYLYPYKLIFDIKMIDKLYVNTHEIEVYCRSHDPKRESQSLRN